MRLLGVPSLRWLPVGLALLLAVEERLTGAAYTGDHNAVALAAAAGSLFLTLVALSRWLTVSKRAAAVGLVALTVTAPGLLSGDLKEAARFALTALLLVSAHALVASSAAERARPLVAWLARVLVVVGFAFSVPALLSASRRASGFLVSSPTLFSYAMLLCVAVLLWWGAKPDLALVFAALLLVLDSGTRTNMAVAGLMLLYRFTLGDRGGVTSLDKALRVSAVLAAMALGGLALLSRGVDVVQVTTDAASRLTQRTNLAASTSTRLAFYTQLLQSLDARGLVVGAGAGASFDTITETVGRRVPAHLDLLTVLVDFGVPGLLLVLALVLGVVLRRGLNGPAGWAALTFLLSGQFHNVVYHPLAVLLSAVIVGAADARPRRGGGAG